MTTNGQVVKEIFNEREERQEEVYGGGRAFFRWVTAGETVSAWWSELRDTQLRDFVKGSDHISGTVNTLRDMMIAIPIHVRARDTTVKAHVRQANQMTEMLMTKTESRGNTASTGWGFGFGAFVEDLHTQDNGAIFAIEGPGKADRELVGAPVKLIHLDAARCQRTGHREYPIIYNDISGKRYKLHHTRIVSMVSMASPIQEMFGVGFSAVSRCINNGQILADISRYKQEKLGSRPRRALIVAEGATQKEVEAIASQLGLSSEAMSNMGLSRYSLIPVVGSKGPLSLLDLASLPDGFDELQSTQLSIAAIALAFGVDMRQLAFAFGVAGQTKADAEVQHLKMQGKGPGAILREVERQFNAKVLPPHLYLEFDHQDDGQDERVASINKIRAEGRNTYISAKIIDTRTARQQMLETGELSEAQFTDLELKDGRLEDGSPLEALFYLNDRDIQLMLQGIDPDEPDQELVEERLPLAYEVALNAPTANLKDKGRQVVALLKRLSGEAEDETPEAADAPKTDKLQPGQSQPPKQLPASTEDRPQPEAETKEAGDDYRAEVARLIEKAQDMSRKAFERELQALTEKALTDTFLDGADLSEDELDEGGQAALRGEIDKALEYIPSLADDVYGGAFLSVEDGGKGNSVEARSGLWGGYAAGVHNLGRTFKGGDPYLQWDRGPTKQPCETCIRLGGQVHRGSEWRKSGFWPQAQSLECKGYRCRCSFSQVKGPSQGEF